MHSFLNQLTLTLTENPYAVSFHFVNGPESYRMMLAKVCPRLAIFLPPRGLFHIRCSLGDNSLGLATISGASRFPWSNWQGPFRYASVAFASLPM